jgi:hypothetical protein
MKKQNNVKRYLVSSLITFIATFLSVFAAQMGDWSAETVTSGIIIGAMLVGARAGVKVLAESLPTLLK